MNEDVFNMQVRKFLKNVGVNSQREIEQAVRDAVEQGKISGNETLNATVTLRLEPLGVETEISGDIALE